MHPVALGQHDQTLAVEIQNDFNHPINLDLVKSDIKMEPTNFLEPEEKDPIGMHGKNETIIKEENDIFLQLDEIKEEPTANEEIDLFSEHKNPLDVSYEFIEYNEEPSSLSQHTTLANIHSQGNEVDLRPEDRTEEGLDCKFCTLPLQNLGHMKSHCMRKPYKCAACKQTFDCSGLLGQHVKLHQKLKKGSR